jgi:hypothetical protein
MKRKRQATVALVSAGAAERAARAAKRARNSRAASATSARQRRLADRADSGVGLVVWRGGDSNGDSNAAGNDAKGSHQSATGVGGVEDRSQAISVSRTSVFQRLFLFPRGSEVDWTAEQLEAFDLVGVDNSQWHISPRPDWQGSLPDTDPTCP